MDISVSPRLRSCRSLPEICCGDRALRRSQNTRSFSRGSASIFRHFGRLRDFLAPVSAWCARYARRPPCPAISRDTTDGFRPITAAMSFCCICAARQREISSLSANVSISRRTQSPRFTRVFARASHSREDPLYGDPIFPVREDGPLHPIAKIGCDQGEHASAGYLEAARWARIGVAAAGCRRGSTVEEATMRPMMHHLNISAVRADALFASALQQSEEPCVRKVREAVAGAVSEFGSRGCAERVAQEFGDHPEIAVARMRWARRVVDASFGGAGLEVAHARLSRQPSLARAGRAA